MRYTSRSGSTEMDQQAIQDFYAAELSHCYGCGRLNADGLQLKSYWDGEETVAIFHPQPYHTAIPGYVYGGLLASIIDCHGTGTAAAAAYRAEQRDLGTEPPIRFLTASLHVDYRRPTPLGVPLQLHGQSRGVQREEGRDRRDDCRGRSRNGPGRSRRGESAPRLAASGTNAQALTATSPCAAGVRRNHRLSDVRAFALRAISALLLTR